MSSTNVTLSIGGRHYVITCAAGEQAHITELGRMIDAKLAQVPGGSGQNENRALLFAGLLLADEIFDLKKAAGAAPTQDIPANHAAGDAEPAMLAHLADRLEAVVAALEVPAWSQPAAQV